jgi:hypothetical protein
MDTGEAVGGQLRLWPDEVPAWGDPALRRIERREREMAALRASVAERTRALIEYLAWRWRVPAPGD